MSMSPLTDAERANFVTFDEAYDDGVVALVRCRLAATIEAGTEVAVMAAIVWDGERYCVTPFAMFMPGNPYDMLVDPTSDEYDEGAA